MQKLEVIALVVRHRPIRLLKRQKSNGPCPSPMMALRGPNTIQGLATE